MKFKANITLVLLATLFVFGFFAVQPAFAQSALDTLQDSGFSPRNDVDPARSFGVQNRNETANKMLLLDNSPLSASLFESDGFAALFNTLLNVIITLAAIWAVIELSYYGAKYALLDSFTGKKSAIENIWPVVYGLIALLGIYLFFKQINPKMLELELGKDAGTQKINLSEQIKTTSPVDVSCVEKTSAGVCKTIYDIEREKRLAKEKQDAYTEASKKLNINPEDYKKYFSGRTRIKQNDFCKDNTDYDNFGTCSVALNYMSACARTAKNCDKTQASDWESLDDYLQENSDIDWDK